MNQRVDIYRTEPTAIVLVMGWLLIDNIFYDLGFIDRIGYQGGIAWASWRSAHEY